MNKYEHNTISACIDALEDAIKDGNSLPLCELDVYTNWGVDMLSFALGGKGYDLKARLIKLGYHPVYPIEWIIQDESSLGDPTYTTCALAHQEDYKGGNLYIGRQGELRREVARKLIVDIKEFFGELK